MENAVSALKIAGAIFIFILGLTILFSMTSLAKETATVLITEADKTNYYQYYEGTEAEFDEHTGNRIVTFDEIIPVLYRYSLENYGVTIVDKNGKIVARFDLDTEAMCNNWLSATSDTKFRFVSEVNKVYDKLEKLLGRNVITDTAFDLKESDLTNIKKEDPDNPDLITSADINDNKNKEIINFFLKHYKQYYNDGGRVRREYYCYWVANRNCVAQRIDSDLSGIEVYFSASKPGTQAENEADSPGNHVPCMSQGLSKWAQGKTFTEYLIEVDKNNYITNEADDPTGEDKLFSFGEIMESIKNEIIYVETET